MTAKLKSIEEHDREAVPKRFAQTPGYATGVACPKCGAELFLFLRSSFAPALPGNRRPVFCRACGHEDAIA